MKNNHAIVVLSIVAMSLCSPVLAQQPDKNMQRPLGNLREKFRNRLPGQNRIPGQGEQITRPGFARDDDDGSSEDAIFMAVTKNFSALKQNDPQRYEMLMKRFDQNQDGILDKHEALEARAEYQKRMQTMPSRPEEKIENAAQLPDDNGLLKGVVIDGFFPPVR